jgi:Arm DNA-binding domain
MKRNHGTMPGQRRIIWDDELPELGPSIEPSGIKVFILRYRSGSGGRKAHRRFVKIGRYGVITPDEARAEAKRLLGEVARGNDPASERAANRNEMTVAGLLRLYEAEGLVVRRGKRCGQPLQFNELRSLDQAACVENGDTATHFGSRDSVSQWLLG